MNTNDVIIGNKNRGLFRFNIRFKMFGREQIIEDAVFDTGCSHSLIPIANLNIGEYTIEKLKEMAYYDINNTVTVGRGVESHGIDLDELKENTLKLNSIKKELKLCGYTDSKNREIIDNSISTEMKNMILSSVNTRFEFRASDYTIDGVNVGDYNVKVSFTLGNVTLIGMHIIKELYTKIFKKDGSVYLLSTLNSADADIKIDKAVKELSECIDSLSEEELSEYTVEY